MCEVCRYQVLADVLRDVAAGFPDSEWVHLGFDEVDPPAALRCTAPHCNAGVCTHAVWEWWF